MVENNVKFKINNDQSIFPDELVAKNPNIHFNKLSETKKARPIRIEVVGDAGVGKTHTFCTIPEFDMKMRKLKIEEIVIVIIDVDDGLEPLKQVNVIPSYIWDRVFEFTITNHSYFDIVQMIDEGIILLEEHYKKTGKYGWLVIDNMDKLWEKLQSAFSQMKYGMDLDVKTLETHKEIYEENVAKGEDKKMKPVFNRQIDYGVMNLLHNKLMEKLVSSNVNLLLTAPATYFRTRENGQEVVTKNIGGQKNIKFYVDYIVEDYTEIITEKGEKKTIHKADFLKNRFDKDAILPVGIRNPSITNLLKAVMDARKKAKESSKEKEMKDLLEAGYTQEQAESLVEKIQK